MKLVNRMYEFLMKLFSIKVVMAVFASWALYHNLINQITWFGCILLLIGGREVAKIMAGRIGIGK